MNLNITYDANTLKNAPSAFFSDVNYVVSLFDSIFTTNATVNIEIGYGSFAYDNSTVSGLGESVENNIVAANYGQVAQQLVSAGAPGANTLPGASPIAGTLLMSSAQEKTLGLIGASGGLDGWVGIASNATLNAQNGGASWSFSPTGVPGANQYYIVGAIEHEISEVMGRVSYLSNGREYGVMDLYRFAGPGVRQTGTGDAAYFSTNGGVTNLGSWNDSRIAAGDIGDWASHAGPSGVFVSAGADAFNDFSNPGVINGLSATDITLMKALGWSAPTASLPALAVTDTTTNQAIAATASPYAGPVMGLQQQYLYSGTDNVNISVSNSNWFLHGGSGDDALAAFGGTNVLDGGSGSNFLSGGGGTDTFFVDDRSPGSDIWSTVSGFHAGDGATVFGISPNGANIQWLDGQGAVGYAGLTLHAASPNQPTASLTLAGYSMADLNSGRLSVTFGSEPDGTPYLYVVANGSAVQSAANAALGDGSSDLLLASGGLSQSPGSSDMTFAGIGSDVPDWGPAGSGDRNGGGSLDDLSRNASSSAAVMQWLHATDQHQGWPAGTTAAWHTAGV